MYVCIYVRHHTVLFSTFTVSVFTSTVRQGMIQTGDDLKAFATHRLNKKMPLLYKSWDR